MLIALAGAYSRGWSSDGIPDPSFNGDGRIYLDLNLTPAGATAASAVQEDGKVITVGMAGVGIAVVRFNADGSLDSGFGPNRGWVTVPITIGNSEGGTSVAVQPDGRIVIAGYTRDGFEGNFVLRLTSSGMLDHSFNGTGFRIIPTPVSAYVRALRILPDGKILLARLDWVFYRIGSDGSFDATFHTTDESVAGIVDYELAGVAVQDDGRIIAFGGGAPTWIVVRLTPVGDPDLSFNTTGKVVTRLPPLAYARSVAIMPDDKIVMAGITYSDDYLQGFATLMRFTSAGILDPTFSGDGKLQMQVTGKNADARLVQRIPGTSGMMVLAQLDDAPCSFALMRLTDAGTLDPAYDGDGIKESVPGPASAQITAGHYHLTSSGAVIVSGGVPGSGASVARFTAGLAEDTTFSGDALATAIIASRPEEPVGMALQPDGKTVVVGQVDIENPAGTGWQSRIALARIQADGRLDPTFGNAGRLLSDLCPIDDRAYSVAVQGDGRILMGGFGQGTGLLWRFNADGTPDTTFGATGKITSAGVWTLLPLASGKFLVGGSDNNFMLQRRLANGSLDTTFQAGGSVSTTIGRQSSIRTLALQSDGKLIAAGMSYYNPENLLAIVRYLANGDLDTSFNGTGIVTVDFADSNQYLGGVLIQPDGKIIVSGGAAIGGVGCAVLARLSTTGVLDGTFGSGGKAQARIGQSAHSPAIPTLQADGKILIACSASRPDDIRTSEFAIARFTANGVLDGTFGTGGELFIPLTNQTQGCALANGALTILGSSKNHLAVARYLVGGAPVPPSVVVTPPALPKRVGPLGFTIAFSAPVTGLTAGDFGVTNGTVSSVTGSGASWSVGITPGLPGEVSCVVLTGAANSAAGTPSLLSNIAVGRYDPFAPAIAITAPTTATTYVTTLSSATITGTASDGSGLASITYALTGATSATGSASGLTTWSVSLPTLSAGSSLLTVTATDTAGNTATDVVTIVRDVTAPTIAITAPTTASTYVTSASSATITGTASDGSGLESVSYTLTGATSATGSANGLATWSVSLLSLAAGSSLLTVTATDTAGNTAMDAVTIVRDVTAPTIAVTTPTTSGSHASATDTVLISGTTSDDRSITGVAYQCIGATTGSGTATGTTAWSLTSPVLAVGTTIFTISGRDEAGNVAQATLVVTYTDPAGSASAAPQGGSGGGCGLGALSALVLGLFGCALRSFSVSRPGRKPSHAADFFSL